MTALLLTSVIFFGWARRGGGGRFSRHLPCSCVATTSSSSLQQQQEHPPLRANNNGVDGLGLERQHGGDSKLPPSKKGRGGGAKEMAGPLFFLRGAQKEGKGKGEEGPPTQKNVGRRPLRKKKIPGCQNKFSNNNKSLAQDKPEGEFCVNIGELVPHTKKAPPVKKLHQHF